MKMLDKGLSNSHRFPDVCANVHRRRIVVVEDHAIELIVHVGEGIVIVIPKGDGILIVDGGEVLLKSRALDGRARLRLLHGRLHYCLQCADRFGSGLNANSAGQIDRPQHEVKCRWAIVGRTRSMGEGTRVDAGLRAVGVDEGCKLCSVSCFALSASLLSTMSMFVTVVGGSVSALTTTALLLLR